MKFFWWGNILAGIWSLVTIVAGITYADGIISNGPLAWYGMIFDEIFGLNTCTLVPRHNQKFGSLKIPCNFCTTPTKYPHGGNPDFVINHGPVNVLDCTGVSGVGGVATSDIAGNNSALVNAVQYINTIFTGSPTGSIGKNAYDKKRFKYGTPNIPQQQGNTIGYYYTTDTKGQEIPLIPPAFGTDVLPAALRDGTTGTTNNSFPEGWNAYVHYANGLFGTAITPLINGTGYSNPIPSTTFDPELGFVVPGVSSDYINTPLTNSYYVSGPLSQVADKEKLKYKQFTVGLEPGAHPDEWTKFQ